MIIMLGEPCWMTSPQFLQTLPYLIKQTENSHTTIHTRITPVKITIQTNHMIKPRNNEQDKTCSASPW